MTPALKQAQERVEELEAMVIPMTTMNVELQAENKLLHKMYAELLAKFIATPTKQ